MDDDKSTEPLSLTAQRKLREPALRERAKEDFIQLGTNASVNKLFQHYRDVIAPQYGREYVPTLHKPDLERWAREDHWYEALAERMTQVTATKRRDYDAIRGLRNDDLHDLSEQAVESLKSIILKEGSTRDDAVKANVAFGILDRIGLTTKRFEKDDSVESVVVRLPDANATDEDLNKFLLQLKNKPT